MTDPIQFERHTETAGVLQPPRRHGVHRGPHRDPHHPLTARPRCRLRRPRGQGRDVSASTAPPRLHRPPRRPQPRRPLLLPREGARRHAKLPRRAAPGGVSAAGLGFQPSPRPRRRHIPREALPPAERVHAQNARGAPGERRSTSPAAPAAFDPPLTHLQVTCNHMLPAGANSPTPTSRCSAERQRPGRTRSSTGTAPAEWKGGSARHELRDDSSSRSRPPASDIWSGGVHGWPRSPRRRPPDDPAVAPAVPRLAAELQRTSTSPRWPPGSLASSPGRGRGALAFNFTLYGGPLDGSDAGLPRWRWARHRPHRPSKQGTTAPTTDFLQKQLGGELMFAAPEETAARLRTCAGHQTSSSSRSSRTRSS